MRIRRHRRTRRQLKKQKKIIIISLVCFMFVMAGGYAAFQTNLNITAKGNIVEKSRIIRKWIHNFEDDFHSYYYRENIVSATFLDTNQVSVEATDSWNVSEDQKHGGVMAWVIPNSEDNTKYDLYIGAKDGVIANQDSSLLFYNFKNLQTINFNDNFDTSKVNSMYELFMGCESLKKLDLSSFNTLNVKNMYRMFYNCKNLTELIIDNFITNQVTTMQDMFNNCNSLKKLNLSNFNTDSVTNMAGMFQNCYDLEEVVLSGFNTVKTQTMAWMFSECRKLTELDLSSFNTINVYNTQGMFYHAYMLTTIYASHEFVTNNVSSSENMFDSNTLLTGGNGTTYFWSFTDKEYARIDTTSTPGYFTLK